MSSKITVQALVSASRQKAWETYTEPDHIVNWNFASDDWHCPSAENKLKVGGVYKARMEAKDGAYGFDFEAVYRELDPGHSFTYELADGRQATVSFEEIGNSTQVTVTFDAETQNPLEMQRAGWQAILDNFKRYAER